MPHQGIIRPALNSFLKILKENRVGVTAGLTIVLFVLIANSVYLLRIADPNPMLQLSNLATSSSKGIVGVHDTLDPNNAFLSQASGHLAATKWLHGEIPYWNSYMGIGAPLGADMQSGSLFFPFVLLLAFSNGLLFMHIILEVLAGIATYLFLRRLKIRPMAATCMGIVFALNGVFSWLQNAVVNPIAFLPLMLLGVEIALSKAKNKQQGGWAVLGLALAFSIYAGFPESVFLNCLFVGGWAVVRVVGLQREDMKRYVSKLAAGALTGLLLAAPILVAFGIYLANSYIGVHSDQAHASFTLPYLSQMFMPYIYGPIFAFQNYDNTNSLVYVWMSVGGYFTISAAVLALFGLFSKLAKPIKLFTALFVAVCLLRIFGAPIVATTVNLIPGIKSIFFDRYAIAVIEFAIIILAAAGLDSILTGGIKPSRGLRIGAGSILGLAFGVLASRHIIFHLRGAPNYALWSVGSVAWACIAVAIICLGAFAVKTKYLPYLLVSLVIADSLVMFMVPTLATPKTTVDLGPVNFLRDHQGLQRFYTLGPIYPNYGSYFGIASVNHQDLPIPATWVAYVQKKLDTNTKGPDFTPQDRLDPTAPDPIAEFFAHLNNYEYVGTKYLVTYPEQVSRALVATHNLRLVYHGPAAYIYALPQPAGYYEAAGKSGCRISSETRNSAEASCRRPAMLVRRELNMDGWTAANNGAGTKITTAGGLFQAVHVPAGKSSLHYSYHPPHIIVGYIAFVIGILLLGASIFTERLPARLRQLIV